MNTITNRDSDKFMLRLPDGMRDRIKTAAERNGRSMNAEIVHTLEQSYPLIPELKEMTNRFQVLSKIVEEMPDGPDKDTARKSILAELKLSLATLQLTIDEAETDQKNEG